MTPLVTVCMATFNSGESVERAVRSVLDQSLTNFELIIVDGGSTDQTLEILRELARHDSRIRLIERRPPSPFISALHTALDATQSPLFALVDGDDFISTNWLEQLSSKALATASIGAFGILVQADDSGLMLGKHPANGVTYAFSAQPDTGTRLNDFLKLPMRLGAVNLLYSVWRTDVFRSIAPVWQPEGERCDDDVRLVLEALSAGSIESDGEAFICRTIPGTRGDLPIFTTDQFDSVDCFVRLAKLDRSVHTLPPWRQVLRFVRETRRFELLWVMSQQVPRAICAIPSRAKQRWTSLRLSRQI